MHEEETFTRLTEDAKPFIWHADSKHLYQQAFNIFIPLTIFSYPESVPSVLIGIFDGYAVARYLQFYKYIDFVDHSRYIGSSFSDVFYDFAFEEEPGSHFPRNLEKSDSILNFYGKDVKILLMDIRSGAGGALYPKGIRVLVLQ